MNVNRVTLRALGTTGVLLAASLTMLAMVSALVTFDAWPTRSGRASASQIQVEPAPAAPVVRAVRQPAGIGCPAAPPACDVPERGELGGAAAAGSAWGDGPTGLRVPVILAGTEGSARLSPPVGRPLIARREFVTIRGSAGAETGTTLSRGFSIAGRGQ